jgi:hypothetical protein
MTEAGGGAPIVTTLWHCFFLGGEAAVAEASTGASAFWIASGLFRRNDEEESMLMAAGMTLRHFREGHFSVTARCEHR